MEHRFFNILVTLCCLLLVGPSGLFAAEEVGTTFTESIETMISKHGATDDSYLSSYDEAGKLSGQDLPAGAEEIRFADAIQLALDQNLDLQASTYGARSAAAALKGSYGLYDPVLSLGFVAGENRDVSNIASVFSTVDMEYREASVSLRQNLPIGTVLTLSGFLDNTELIPAPTVNPYYDSRLAVGLVQPLLKGFGTTPTEQQIIFAAKDKQIALQVLRESAFNVVAEVRNAYFVILQAQYDLSYRRASVELAKRIVSDNAARVAAGVMPKVESLEAEVGLQQRERLLLDAQRFYADALDNFNLLLNSGDKVYVPVMQPFNMRFDPVENAGVEAGLQKRPDIISRLMVIEKTMAEHAVARNALLPELDLFASYGVNGFAGDLGDSLDNATDADNDGWEVGVNFSYPLGSIESRNQAKRSELKLKQERSGLSQLYNEVRIQVRAAIRNIEVSRKKTEAATRGHELALEKLRILLKSHEVGLATTRNVLDGEEDLAIARTDQIVSVAEYFKAITEYLRVTGTLLENENITFMGDFGPDLDRSPFYIR